MMVQVYVDIRDRASHFFAFGVYLGLEHAFLLEKLNLGVKDVSAPVLCKIFSLAACCHEIRGGKRQQVDLLIKRNLWALGPAILI